MSVTLEIGQLLQELPLVDSLSEEQLAQLLDGFRNVSDVIKLVIPIIPLIKSDEILNQLSEINKELGSQSWRLQIAIDHETIHRITLHAGCKSKDIDQVGVVASVNKLASERGCSPRKIWKNDQVHRTFFLIVDPIVEAAANVLQDDYEFYSIAAQANDPKKALEVFADNKMQNASFSSRDAKRMLGIINPNFTSTSVDMRNALLDAIESVLAIWKETYGPLEDDLLIRKKFKVLQREYDRINRPERLPKPKGLKKRGL